MPTIQVGPDSDLELQVVADIMGKSRKVVVMTGAGISTNCGIPDFRSQNGLYALVQAQYDAALKNPPWEQSDEFDIDDRPKKKRKQWYYEVVAPDGKVVDVIDEEIAPRETSPPEDSQPEDSQPEISQQEIAPSETSPPETSLPETSLPEPSQPEPQQPEPNSNFQTPHTPKRISLSRSSITNTTTSDSRATTPSVISSVESSLSSCSSLTPEVPISFSQIALSREKSPLLAHIRSTNSIAHSSDLSDTRESSQVSSPVPSQPSSSQGSSSQEQTFNAQSLSQNSSGPARGSLPNLKGRDLFDAMVWQDSWTTSIFYMFATSLRQKVKSIGITTESHKFLRVLRDGGRLVRNYSQNIDLMEEREGLCTELSKGTGSRGRFSRRSGVGVGDSGHGDRGGGCESVQLHGSLERLRCALCNSESDWDDQDRVATTLSGSAPDCPTCESYSQKRAGTGRRRIAIGRLRPNIVLYGEEHPKNNLISPIVEHDLALGPDVLLIMGTSLRVHGLKIMIKEFAKVVHSRGGKVVFVNYTKPPESTWGDVIDYWVEWDCDKWVIDLKSRREDLWLPPGAVTADRRKSAGTTTGDRRKSVAAVADGRRKSGDSVANAPRKRPQCLRDDRQNGAYVVFKLLDQLGTFKDDKGRPTQRKKYWTRPPLRAPIPVKNGKSVKSVPVKGTFKIKLKNLQKPFVLTGDYATSSNKQKSKAELTLEATYLQDNQATIVANQWENLRTLAPQLGQAPPYLQAPFIQFKGNLLPEYTQSKGEAPKYLTPYAFGSSSNHLPRICFPSDWVSKINLLSHPPMGADLPIHTPKSPESKRVRVPAPSKPLPEERKIEHLYGTRASKRFSTADTMVMDTSEGTGVAEQFTNGTENGIADEAEATIVVEETIIVNTETAGTPTSDHIKRSCSIDAIISSPEDGITWHDAQEML